MYTNLLSSSFFQLSLFNLSDYSLWIKVAFHSIVENSAPFIIQKLNLLLLFFAAVSAGALLIGCALFLWYLGLYSFLAWCYITSASAFLCIDDRFFDTRSLLASIWERMEEKRCLLCRFSSSLLVSEHQALTYNIEHRTHCILALNWIKEL